MNPAVLRHIERLWNYHKLSMRIVAADVVIALGGDDLRVARRAADLFLNNDAPVCLCTGGIAHQQDLLATGWDEPEAVVFGRELVRCGVPANRIVLETKATNTAENIAFTKMVIQEKFPDTHSAILVTRPHMERRVFATAGKVWPEVRFSVSSPSGTLQDYCADEAALTRVAHLMVGDLQRLMDYGARGWSLPQDIPASIDESWHYLKETGFTKHLRSA